MPPTQPLITRRPLKCDGPAPQWVSKALETAQQVKVLTLAIPVAAPTTSTPSSSSPSLRLLLGRKKRGFGEGYFNGFGGKLEPGESTDQAAVRELCEESGLTATALEHVGVLTFVFDDQTERPWQVHVYAVPSWKGSPEETEEMAPVWFEAPKELPFGRMWADDRYWYPRFVEAVSMAARAETTTSGGDTDNNNFTTISAPCFEGVFGFRSTHEMAWAGLWALERPGEPRSVVADEAARAGAAGGEEGDSGSGPRDNVGNNNASPCPWLPLAPAGGEKLVSESLAHLQRADELARATAAVNGGKPTAWRGFVGDRNVGVVAGAAVAV